MSVLHEVNGLVLQTEVQKDKVEQKEHLLQDHRLGILTLGRPEVEVKI